MFIEISVEEIASHLRANGFKPGESDWGDPILDFLEEKYQMETKVMSLLDPPKPLKTTMTVVHEVQADDIEALIKKVYGRRFEITVANEKMTHSVSKGELSEYHTGRLQTWCSTGKGMSMFLTIFQDLCNKGLVPEGDYVIDGTW